MAVEIRGVTGAISPTANHNDRVEAAVLVLSEDNSSFLEVNSRAVEMLGFSRDELLSLTPDEILDSSHDAGRAQVNIEPTNQPNNRGKYRSHNNQGETSVDNAWCHVNDTITLRHANGQSLFCRASWG